MRLRPAAARGSARADPGKASSEAAASGWFGSPASDLELGALVSKV